MPPLQCNNFLQQRLKLYSLIWTISSQPKVTIQFMHPGFNITNLQLIILMTKYVLQLPLGLLGNPKLVKIKATLITAVFYLANNLPIRITSIIYQSLKRKTHKTEQKNNSNRLLNLRRKDLKINLTLRLN